MLHCMLASRTRQVRHPRIYALRPSSALPPLPVPRSLLRTLRNILQRVQRRYHQYQLSPADTALAIDSENRMHPCR